MKARIKNPPAPAAPTGAPAGFRMEIPQPVLDDLRERLVRTRWPDPSPEKDWDQGTDLAFLRELATYWEKEFDWRRQEQRWNALQQFKAIVDGTEIHFVHVRGRGPR